MLCAKEYKTVTISLTVFCVSSSHNHSPIMFSVLSTHRWTVCASRIYSLMTIEQATVTLTTTNAKDAHWEFQKQSKMESTVFTSSHLKHDFLVQTSFLGLVCFQQLMERYSHLSRQIHCILNLHQVIFQFWSQETLFIILEEKHLKPEWKLL